MPEAGYVYKRDLEDERRKVDGPQKFEPKGIKSGDLNRSFKKGDLSGLPKQAIGRPSEATRKNDLALSRKNNPASEAKQMADTAKTMAKAATPTGAISLASQFRLGTDWIMAIPLSTAALKDILDYAGFSLPAINEVFNFMAGLTTTGVLLLLGSNRGTQRMVKGATKKWFVLIGGFLGEELFGLNLLPVETISVVIIFMMLLAERKQEAHGT